MKNLNACSLVLSLLCLVFLFVPSTMLAQEEGPPPCCYGPPPDQSPQGLNIDTQNMILLLGVLIDISLSQPDSGTDTVTTATIAGNRPSPLMRPKDSIQAIHFRRANYLIA